MYYKVKAYMEEHHMVEQQDIVIAGVSGGADSICLLCVLKELGDIMGFSVTAVHVHHGLRGEEADRDEWFVRTFCADRGIPLKAVHVDVAACARERKMSEEEAGREVRREVFEQERRRTGGTKIALAHHMEDNAETILLNLARGTGLYGAAGIRPTAGRVIHPLLCVSRKEIEQWLEKKGISYCIDRTNLEDTYTRNRIRRHLIPWMKEQVNTGTVEHMNRFAERMGSLRDYVERQVETSLELCVKTEGEGQVRRYFVERKGFFEVDKALRPYLLKRVLGLAAGREKDIEAIHLEQIEALFSRQPGRQISLPYGLRGVRRYEGVSIEAKEQLEERCLSRGRMETRVFSCERIPETFPADPYTKWFDYDIIQHGILLRTREPGDYITIDRMGHTQKLKKYFVNEKIPEEKRDQVLLVADGSHIMWVAGYRQNQRYQVTEYTERILEIKIVDYEGENDGRNN